MLNHSKVSVVSFFSNEDVEMETYKEYDARSYPDYRPVKVLLLGTIALTLDTVKRLTGGGLGGTSTHTLWLDDILRNMSVVERVRNGTATFGVILFENGDQGICAYEQDPAKFEATPIVKAVYIDDHFLPVWDEFDTLIATERHALMHDLLAEIVENRNAMKALRRKWFNQRDLVSVAGSGVNKADLNVIQDEIRNYEVKCKSLTRKAAQYMQINS